MTQVLSASEWLKKYRNDGCPQHGYHLADSLVKTTGYCSKCNQFWRFVRRIEMKDIPYHWYYFDIETNRPIGKVYSGRKQHGKQGSDRNKTRFREHKGNG